MFHRLKQLITPHPTSLNTIEISQQAILDNVSLLQSLKPDDAIFPVLKSNAYGHGLQHICQIIDKTSVPLVCVDSYPEYQFVRKRTSKRALILGETAPENYRFYRPKHASIAVYNIPTLKYLSTKKRKQTIHLFLNTGMNREGIQLHDLGQAIDILNHAGHITLEGIMSHVANADELDSAYCTTQIDQYKKMYAIIKQTYHHLDEENIYKHIGNSASIAKIDDPFFTAWRSGLAMYGYNPLDPSDSASTVFSNLQPALRITSTVVSKQQLQAGDIVGYGGRFTAPEPLVSATLPFGYHEGLMRSLSAQRSVKRQEHYLPLIGTISMNLCSFHTQQHQVGIGDTVEIISSHTSAPNNIYSFASKAQTIPYEVLVNLDEKAKRIIT